MNSYFLFYMPLMLGLMTIYLFVIGLRLLITRKPVVMSSRWTVSFIALAFSPQLLNTFFLKWPAKGLGMMQWISPLMFLTVMVIIIISMRGYAVFGVTEDYFREAVLGTVASLGFTVEETMSCLRIKETGQEIKIMVQGAMGSAQITPKSKDSHALVQQIAKGMRTYFRGHAGKTKMLIAYFYILLGVFLLATGISLGMCTRHLH
jgi:RsiW-degrading membrane proteinase PrsW (M82 family)